jgi:hypothetical protein
MLLLPIAFFYGCNDAPTTPTSRIGATPHALLAPVVTVTNTDDDGPGSLRQAISIAPAGAVIQFDAAIAGRTIVLSSGQLLIAQALTIEGPVPAGMTISGGLSSRVFRVNVSGDVIFRNLAIVNGYDPAPGEGGGAIALLGTALLDHVLVANNQTENNGGGISVLSSGRLTLVNSTVSGNFGFSVGGIYSNGTATIWNSTIANNLSAPGFGGGIFADGRVYLRNSIIANNGDNDDATVDANCRPGTNGLFLYSGTNLSNDDSCGSAANTVIANPLLAPLADNGGPTKTHALGESSPAIDAGTLCSESTDQRYVTRNQGRTCDIGAFEFNDFGTITLTIGPNVAVNTKTGSASLTGTITCSKPATVGFDVGMSQTQKTTGRFTTIAQATASIPVGSCGTSPSSWSVALTPQAGKFEPGSATGSATTTVKPASFLAATVTSPLKLFQVK